MGEGRGSGVGGYVDRGREEKVKGQRDEGWHVGCKFSMPVRRNRSAQMFYLNWLVSFLTCD